MSTEYSHIDDNLTLDKNQANLSQDSKKIISQVKSNQSFAKSIVSVHLQDIFQEPKRPQTGKSDVEKRLIDYQTKVNKKIEDLKKEKEEQDKQACTFQPKTSIPASSDRKFSHFLHHMDQVNEAKKKNLENLQKNKEEEESKEKASFFKPTLSKQTQKIATKNKSASDLHMKLYKESEELKKKKENESQAVLNEICTFKPKLGKKTQGVKREGKLTQRLYEEAAKKKDRLKNTETVLPSAELISEESKNIVREKFLKDINEVVVGETINFDEFIQMLTKTGFLRTAEGKFEDDKALAAKAWKTFEENEESKTTGEKIKNFLLNLMNLRTEESSKKIHLDFLVLYENRKNVKKPEEPAKVKGYSFAPRINPVSKDLSSRIKDKRLSKYSTAKPEKVLEIIEKEGKKKLEDKRNKNLDEELRPCSFKPVTKRGPVLTEESIADNCSLSSDYFKILAEKNQHRCEMLYNFSKVESEKKTMIMRSTDDYELEKNMSECTFTPNLDKKIKKSEEPEQEKKKKFVSPPVHKLSNNTVKIQKTRTGVSNSSDGQSYLADMIKTFLEK